jgi:hypothetical protein
MTTVSAVFDNQHDAQQAIAALRQAGVSDGSLSLITRKGERAPSADGDDGDDDHTNIARGILGGGALGAGLAVAALAIPGVGPLAAAGAIAASAVPEALAIGAIAGAAAGTFNESLKNHGVSDEDADYYGERIGNGGVVVTVSGDGTVDPDTAFDILRRNGGHTSSTRPANTAFSEI